MLNHQDIEEILRLLDDAPYDELHLKTGRFELHLARQGDGWTQETRSAASEAPLGEAPAATEPAPQAAEIQASESGLLDIRSPMTGTFYRAPKPGAEPFVEVGSRVDEQSIIAIIEVMKLMSSIPAGLRGEVREILADNGETVTKGQLLMRVRPA